jgi:diguanylate cyclase (GGDEF)-like protein/PAS domain S-box-containing protein
MGFKIISKRLLLIFITLFIVFATIKTAYSYYNTKKLEKEFVKRQAESLNSFMLIHRNYYQKLYINNTYQLNEKTAVGLPAFSAREISEKFSKHNSFNITVKTVSDNPRNPLNSADKYELKAINLFKKNKNIKEYLKRESKDYQYATPLYIEKKCLSCHGKREDAPDFISKSYDRAYDYKLGQLRGIISIKIPIKETHQYFISQFYKSLFFDLVVILIISLAIAYLIRYFKFLNNKLEIEIKSRTHDLQENIAVFKSCKVAIDKSSIVIRTDTNGLISDVNDNFLNLSGYAREEIIQNSNKIIKYLDIDFKYIREFYNILKYKKSWKGIFKNRAKNGKTFWLDMHVTPIFNASGEILEYISISQDITELMLQRKTLEKNAYLDNLTGLHNRVKLLEMLPTIETPAIALFDIDNFSQTNDFYGSKIGDKLIIELSLILKKMIQNSEKEYLFRLNGDEFVFLCTYKDKRKFIKKVTLALDTIHATPILIDNSEIPLDVTVGISFEERSNLLSTADITLKHAKQTKKQMLVYKASFSIDKSYEKNMFWSKELKKAIKNDKLVPYYQPIINNQTKEIDKYETLIRLIDDDGKIISPFFFLDVAKHSKQYHYITRTIIDKSFETFSSLKYNFSINLTIEDILDKQIQKYLFNALKYYNIGERVVFEIVEDEGIENFDIINEFIIKVRKFGCKIAIDDFGTGYSNFEYLIKLKADFIKIDGSIIKNLETDKSARILVTTIVVFAKKIGMKTIAEFVKNEKIQELVVELGIDYSQGYYFGEPQPTPQEILGE